MVHHALLIVEGYPFPLTNYRKALVQGVSSIYNDLFNFFLERSTTLLRPYKYGSFDISSKFQYY